MHIIGMTVSAAAIFAFLEVFRELHTFQITHYEIESEKLKGMKGKRTIVFLSDLHNHVYGKDNDTLFEAIRNERPDYILIGGDMLVGKTGKEISKTAAFMRRLPSICPVYCANGNHEQRMKEKPYIYGGAYEHYREIMKKSGVHMLENAYADLSFGDAKVRITGLEIPLSCYEHWKRKQLSKEEIDNRIGNAAGGYFHILMAHNPAYAKVYRKWGADVILSGHLHGGIVRIPGIGGVISPQMSLLPRHSGEMKSENGIYTIVSKGLGTHTVNVRFCNPAEVVSITFQAK